MSTTRGDEYVAERYSVIDSMLVIENVVFAGKPMVDSMAIPLRDVDSIRRMERHVPLYVAIGGVVLFIGAIALMTGGDAFTD